MAKNSKTTNPKRVAYEKKQAKQGEKVVKWIIGVLILLAIGYTAWSIYIIS